MNPAQSIIIVLKVLFIPAWWLLSLFGGAGQLTWNRGWICTVLYLGAISACRAVLAKFNPDILKEREEVVRKNTKPFDKILLNLLLTLTIVLPVIAGFDAVRFNWTSPMPFWTMYPGIVLFTGSAILITWVMVKNPHAESSVRIQEDRGHAVIRSGPYRFVRHPMYTGLILLYTSMALVLGSMWTLAVAALIAILLMGRTAMEEKTLRQELLGYEEYTTVTRYRLMPGIW
ncbi:MAG TPA: isoprenylcysteine carboxylmethyltransferase family protein [Granulicella sp.]|jgi:protein-S-isoprenylcysteine O-methyltransferase Ste14